MVAMETMLVPNMIVSEDDDCFPEMKILRGMLKVVEQKQFRIYFRFHFTIEINCILNVCCNKWN